MRTFGPACTLGEGPLWHPGRHELFWFDIPHGTLYSAKADGTMVGEWSFGEAASACGWLDHDRMVVATASGLRDFNITTGAHTGLVDIEADNPVTRSNDGRIGPDGAFWIGTMGHHLERRAGAYYRYARGTLTKLFDEVTVPNATCFSPDGRIAYLADTARRLIWRWALAEDGAPVGDKEVHINLKDEGLNPDGAVCDAEGYLWNAQWGASRVARYDPKGQFVSAIDLPASQITCPAFGGEDLKTLFVTSARENLTAEHLVQEPDAGRTFAIEVDVPGIPENRAVL
ncbi:MAG: SMP-30/gluconolactonase/LRE family protein [Pseudomonadota bacterium]